jgi:hypothetical protein
MIYHGPEDPAFESRNGQVTTVFSTVTKQGLKTVSMENDGVADTLGLITKKNTSVGESKDQEITQREGV